MLKEIRTRGDIILFIDELHTLVGAGAAEGAIDAASILKPMLARGELQTIGATTLDEYRKHLEKDAALERRFQPIKVERADPGPHHRDPEGPPRPLRGPPLGHHHRPGPRGRGQPGRPLHRRPLPPRQGHRPHRRGRLQAAHPAHGRAAGAQGARRADRSRSARRRRRPSSASSSTSPSACASEEEQAPRARRRPRTPRPGPPASTCSTSSTRRSSPRCWPTGPGIPVYKLTEEETAKLLRMEDELHKRVIGQHDAIKAVVPGHPAHPGRPEGPEAPRRLVHLPRPVGRREDRDWPRRSPSSSSATRTR